MKQRVLAAGLCAAMVVGAALPASANGAASTRNIFVFGAAAAGILIAHDNRLRAQRQHQQELERRQNAYRDWFYSKYGYYPTQDQFVQWYKRTYGVVPQ